MKTQDETDGHENKLGKAHGAQFRRSADEVSNQPSNASRNDVTDNRVHSQDEIQHSPFRSQRQVKNQAATGTAIEVFSFNGILSMHC